MPAQRAGNLEAVFAPLGQRPQRSLGQAHRLGHIPVVEEILVVGQRVERGAAARQRLAHQFLRTQAPEMVVLVADDEVAEGIGPENFDGAHANPAPGLVDVVYIDHGHRP